MKKWTIEEEELLKCFCEHGYSYLEIANELDRSRESVSIKASRLLLSNNTYIKKWTKKEEELLKYFCAHGYSYIEIANKLDRTQASIKQCCTKLNINNGKGHYVNNEIYLKKLKEINSTLFPLEPYINAKTKILHKCNLCGIEALYTPNDRIQGHGCRYCANKRRGYKIDKDKPGIAYLIWFPEFNLYKIGITSRTVKERYYGYTNYEIILERYFNTGIEAMVLEEEWLYNIKPYLVNTGLLFDGGNTETFIY